jgi:hypothetical protein
VRMCWCACATCAGRTGGGLLRAFLGKPSSSPCLSMTAPLNLCLLSPSTFAH